MSRRLELRSIALPGVVLFALAACTAAPGGQSSSPMASSPPRASSTSQATSSPTPEPTPSPSPSPSELAEPPVATLRSAEGPGVAGDLGSYTIGSKGSDSPWLPGEPATANAGEALTIDLAGVAIERWQARIGSAPDTDARGLGEGTGPIRFAAPRRGTWSLSVRVMFAGGDATYYWALTVR